MVDSINSSERVDRKIIILLGIPVLAYLSTRQILLSVTSWEEWLIADYLGRILILAYALAIPSVRIETIRMFQRPWLTFFGHQRFVIFVAAILAALVFEWFINHVRGAVFEIFPDTAMFRTFYIEIRFWHIFDLTIGLMLVALSEEILFRGYLFRILRQIINQPTIIIAVAAVIFGLMHWPSGIPNIVVTSISGITFGILYLWSKSLLPGVIAHYLINLGHFWPS